MVIKEKDISLINSKVKKCYPFSIPHLIIAETHC